MFATNGAPGIPTRSKDATNGASGLTTRNKKLTSSDGAKGWVNRVQMRSERGFLSDDVLFNCEESEAYVAVMTPLIDCRDLRTPNHER